MNEGHIEFGEVVCEHFNIPRHYRWWAAIPDMKYFSKEQYTHLLLHRWSLHGIPNVQTCVKQGKVTNYAPYKLRYRDVIETLIISHSYLDTFNGIVVPSYPHSLELRWNSKLRWRYISSDPLDDPPHIKDVFWEIVQEYNTVGSLQHDILEEYEMLPKYSGVITSNILKEYL